ncbi:response regulator transcription factor [Paucilactobacillus suebicus]|nr:response regulator transcription factor [Paucilactobacillus suebicus]
MVKVMIVDDQPIYRLGLRTAFKTNLAFEVVEEARNGQEALDFLEQHNDVEVILLDIKMPIMDGITALKSIKKKFANICTIVLTSYEDLNDFNAAMKLNVNGFLLKNTDEDELFKSINEALQGEITVSPELIKDSIAAHEVISELGRDDIGIIKEIASGARNSEIANSFHLSERTIKSHLTNIYTVLKVSSRTQAVAKAIHYEIIKL